MLKLVVHTLTGKL